MSSPDAPERSLHGPDRRIKGPDAQFAIALARAFGGAVIFALPLLMTMEMWSLGAVLPPARLALLIAVWIPLLVGLSAVSGFERTVRLRHDALDAFVALAVGAVSAAIVLSLLGILRQELTSREVTGMIALQALPGSMGALLAVSQFGGREKREKRRRADTWAGEMFLMAVGALFLALNVAPTEEITLLGMMMTPVQSALVLLLSLLVMHAFVYAMEFSGQASIPRGTPFHSVFLRYTASGYAIVLLLSAYTLWSFDRFAGLPSSEVLSLCIALGLPGAVGAAAARLLL